MLRRLTGRVTNCNVALLLHTIAEFPEFVSVWDTVIDHKERGDIIGAGEGGDTVCVEKGRGHSLCRKGRGYSSFSRR